MESFFYIAEAGSTLLWLVILYLIWLLSFVYAKNEALFFLLSRKFQSFILIPTKSVSVLFLFQYKAELS